MNFTENKPLPEHNFKIEKSSIIDCDDITSGFFAYSEIRFGRPSDYSEECFRKWDSRNMFKSTNVTTFVTFEAMAAFW